MILDIDFVVRPFLPAVVLYYLDAVGEFVDDDRFNGVSDVKVV